MGDNDPIDCLEIGAKQLSALINEAQLETEVLYGEDALNFIASDQQVDIVMAAIVGAAGLLPTLAAAKGVPFLAPLKPSEPLEDQIIALPSRSVKSTLVLLYVDCTWSIPKSICLRLEVDCL